MPEPTTHSQPDPGELIEGRLDQVLRATLTIDGQLNQLRDEINELEKKATPLRREAQNLRLALFNLLGDHRSGPGDANAVNSMRINEIRNESAESSRAK